MSQAQRVILDLRVIQALLDRQVILVTRVILDLLDIQDTLGLQDLLDQKETLPYLTLHPLVHQLEMFGIILLTAEAMFIITMAAQLNGLNSVKQTLDQQAQLATLDLLVMLVNGIPHK